MSNTTRFDDLGPGLEDFSLQHEAPLVGAASLDTMSQAELLALHGEIEARLTHITLDTLDLPRETMVQLQKAKLLQAAASAKDAKVPVNQQAQVQNSIAAIITSLAKVQMELYTSERYKRIQAAVVRVVKELPKDKQDMFFDLLEKELGEEEKILASDEVSSDPLPYKGEMSDYVGTSEAQHGLV